jgi:hypothetical protein
VSDQLFSTSEFDVDSNTYDFLATYFARRAEKKRTRQAANRRLRERITTKIEGNPVEFGLQLGLGILLSVATAKLTKGVMRRTFMGPKVPASDPQVALMLSSSDLDLINNALKEAAK